MASAIRFRKKKNQPDECLMLYPSGMKKWVQVEITPIERKCRVRMLHDGTEKWVNESLVRKAAAHLHPSTAIKVGDEVGAGGWDDLPSTAWCVCVITQILPKTNTAKNILVKRYRDGKQKYVSISELKESLKPPASAVQAVK